MQQSFGGIKYRNPVNGNYINLPALTGLQGKTPTLRKGLNGIEVSYDDGTSWQDLISFSELVYYAVDDQLSQVSENTLQNKIIAAILNPISETEYEQLQDYTQPVYFIYDDEE